MLTKVCKERKNLMSPLKTEMNKLNSEQILDCFWKMIKDSGTSSSSIASSGIKTYE